MANGSSGVFVPSLKEAKLLRITFSIVLLGLTTGCDKAAPLQSPIAPLPTIGKCLTVATVCIVDAGVGISGLARISETTYLTVHDAHNGPGQRGLDRLGVLTLVGSPGRYGYTAIKVDPTKWEGPDEKKVASDLESACKLSEGKNEFLVAESGRTDVYNTSGLLTKNAHQGRIFHLELDLTAASGSQITVRITPNLILAKVSTPPPVSPKPGESIAAVHSKENYEGMACIFLNNDAGGKANYLVILGERGGNDPVIQPPPTTPATTPATTPTRTARLYWGIYETGQDDKVRAIKWQTATNASGIIAPGKGTRSDEKWRDITGLHIDQDGILWATAAFDTDQDWPPFGGVVYKLGYVCVSAVGDRHGEVCDYTQAPRPVLFTPFVAGSTFSWRKPEAVAAPAGQQPVQGSVSVGTEDEDAGGAWWPVLP